MTVGLILAEKGREVLSIPPDASMSDAVDLLAGKRIGAVVVTDARGKLVGIVSERDIVREISVHGAAVLDRPVSSCMTRSVVTCQETDTIDQVMAAMTAHRFRHMPVVNAGRLVGLVSIGDVVKSKIRQAEHDAEELRNYIALS